ncbi:MAG TPA: hypothetical protein VK658_14475 [Chryseolinea sp.]|nr:hypothetical protein [Chryseolinea sp.]
MPSIVRDFSYDIFISYRQKDDQYDGWVTDFVNNLQRELAATSKEDVSVYFDANPRDGLLETHQVDDSIQEKLKCLIFIPIVSKTYCDVKSYAWSREFLPFLKQASEDALGLKVRLSTGNVASRVIPVCIHDIEQADKTLLEKEVGPLRSVDFTFTAPGVNRPLRDREERPFDNHKPLFYRNQINKLANAIGEIISRLTNSSEAEAMAPTSMELKINTRQKSIAVLPFTNMSRDVEQEYFSDGISEEIINMLVKIPGLNVAGRTSSFSFKNKNEDLRTIAEKLNVDHILEGSIRNSGNLIRITAQLVEASTGFHLWSEKYDREIHDVFAIQDEIAKVIADKLKVTLYDSGDKIIERVQTHNVEAYQLYLKGRSLYYKRGIELFDAQRCFEAALKVDSNYALAWAGLTDTYSMLCFHSFIPPEEVWPKALHAANRAMETGPDLAESHGALGTIALLYERNWEKAEREYLKALELNPRYLQARSWYSLFYLQSIRTDHSAAMEQAKISIESDPLSAYAYCILGMVDARANDISGIAAALKAVEFQPDAFLPWYTLGNCYHWSGSHKKATDAYNHALEVSGRHAWALNSLLQNFVEAQQWKEAESIYHELLLRSKTGHVLPSLLAMASAAMGKNDEAMRYIYEAYERHDAFLLQCFNVWPDNKHLLAIPEYAVFLKRFELSPSEVPDVRS